MTKTVVTSRWVRWPSTKKKMTCLGMQDPANRRNPQAVCPHCNPIQKESDIYQKHITETASSRRGFGKLLDSMPEVPGQPAS